MRPGAVLYSHFPYQLFLFLTLYSLTGCREHVANPNAHVSLRDYASLATDDYRLLPRRVRSTVLSLAASDSDSTLADFYARSHYAKRRGLMWINRKGVSPQADSLIVRLRTVTRLGFSPVKFRLPQIEADLERARNLRFDNGQNTVSRVYGRLEYNLTKACFRYAAGQRFGYVNPKKLFNQLDIHDTTSGRVTYDILFDLPCPTPGSSFFHQTSQAISNDSLDTFLDGGEPHNAYYSRLLQLLNSDSVSYYGRKLILVNLERTRWRLNTYPWDEQKKVLVNIPSFHLLAIDGEKVLNMRIGCGSLESKTPMLCSDINRMDVNPQWIMPRSIVRKSIIPRLGNPAYFKQHRYFIRERATGDILPPSWGLRYGLESGDYLAIQEGGEGNALGRIIFRFNNDFSIYLHDTSSKNVFSRNDRDVSHGCIRVERPFDLAVFLLGKGHDATIRKIHYSMHADVSPLGKRKRDLTEDEAQVYDTLQKKMLISTVTVKPVVPVYIIYFTLYPNEHGKLSAYRDVYGYDNLIYNQLKNYI